MSISSYSSLAAVVTYLLISCCTHTLGLDNGLALTPPRGFSTWNAYPNASISEATCRKYLHGLIKAGLPRLNYTYFIVDEPCFAGRDANGALVENRTRWPNGLKAFGKELHRHGMKLGIYTCVGPTTCAGCVGSEGHEVQDMQTFADWGAEYIKVDSCARNCSKAAGVPNASDPACGKTLWSRYTDAIKKTRKPMVYSLIGNLDPARGEQPWKYAYNVSNSWRTNIDIQIGFQSIPYIVDAQRRMGGNGSWCSFNRSLPDGPGYPCGLDGLPCPRCPGPRSFSGPGHWNDMDMLAIGTRSWLFGQPLTEGQSRAQLALWAILKSPLLVSADLGGVGRGLLEILKNEEVLAVSDDPLGREAKRLQGGRSIGECYVGETIRGWAAVLFNRNWGSNATMRLALEDFVDVADTSLVQQWRVRDLWRRRDLGLVSSRGSFETVVPGEDALMISLVPLLEPWKELRI